MTGQSLLYYQVLQKIGEGGMGVVYLARDTRLGRTVALKILRPEQSSDPRRVQRFLREARAAAALNHPNIVAIYDIGKDRDIDFIAMEHISGESLYALMKRGQLPVSAIVSHACQIASGLAKAHAAGVVHRDLKPANVMVSGDGHVKLLDFGLAQLSPILALEPGGDQDTATVSALTQFGSVQGTIAYMSPEQARGEPVDSRSDVFAFGVMLYEMLGGRRPFHGSNTVALLHAIAYVPPQPPVEQIREDAPPQLIQLVARCLEKEREKRFQNMDEVAATLRGLMNVQPSPLPAETAATGLPPHAPPGKRMLWAVAGIVAVALAAFALSPSGRRIRAQFLSPHALPEPAELRKQGYQSLRRFDKQGSEERAISDFQKSLTMDPDNADAYAGLGMAYASQHATNADPQFLHQARTNAAHALELNPLLANAHVSMGVVLTEEDKYADAERELRRALQLEPNNADAMLYLGFSLRNQNRLDEAADVYRKMVQIHPDDWRPRNFLAALYYRQGKFEQAVTEFKKALSITPDNIAVLRLLGVTYHMWGRDPEAAETLQQALAIRPTLGIYTNLGVVYFFSGRYQDALAAFQQAMKLGGNDYIAWANLGDAYRYTPGNEVRARQAYAQAVKLVDAKLSSAPDSAALLSRKASYLAKSGEKEQARAVIDRALSLPTLGGFELFSLGLAQEFIGNRASALKLLAEAVKKGYSMPEIQGTPDLIALRRDPGYHLIVLEASNGK